MEVFYGFELSTSSPVMQFEYRLPDFKLEIISAELFVAEGANWQSLLSKLEIRAHVMAGDLLQYLAPISLFNNPNSNQPFFELNKVIDKRVFEAGTDLSVIDKIHVKLELIQLQDISESFEFHFRTLTNCS
jgi:hypothetical protein